MIIYLNIKTNYGTETIDELNLSDFQTYRDFKKELSRLTYEYRLSGMQVYRSQRSTKEWRNRN